MNTHKISDGWYWAREDSKFEIVRIESNHLENAELFVTDREGGQDPKLWELGARICDLDGLMPPFVL